MIEVRAGYDAWAASYDDMRNKTRDLDAQVLRSQSFHLAGAMVVEIGCGTGKNTEWLSAHADRVIALDFSPGMLALAKAKVTSRNVEFRQQDILQPWGLPDGFADLVVGDLVLEHVEDMTPVFVEALRVLKPNGTLFICELHPYRQLLGQQAQFQVVTGETIYVRAYRHTVSEFADAGIRTGFTLAHIGEWGGSDSEPPTGPVLLSMTFRR